MIALRRLWLPLTLAAVLLCASGCAGGVREFVVGQRNHQGDLALSRGNLAEAKIGYRLALQLSPQDQHAKEGLVEVLTQLAEQLYEHSDFEGAMTALAQAESYDPQSVRVAELHSQVEQAKIKRQIVIANFPNYAGTGKQILRGYEELPALNKGITKALKRFAYTYDSANVTDAIKQSYSMQEEVTRLTNGLIAYRQLVESGASGKAGAAVPAAAGSLLPLP